MTSIDRAWYRTAGALAAAGLLALACSSDSTAPKITQPPDLASIFGEMSLAPNPPGSAVTGGLAVWTPGLGSSTISPAACTFSSSAQEFVCPPIQRDGITITRTYALYDAAGHPQSHPDVNTASVRVQTTVKGTTTFTGIPGATRTHTIDRQDDRTVSGINTGHHVLNSVAAGTANGTDSYNGSMNTFSFTDVDTALDLALPAVGSGQWWPQSGSTRTHVVGTASFGTLTIPTKVDMIMTFNGNNTATLVITSDGVTTTCKVDLSQSWNSCGP